MSIAMGAGLGGLAVVLLAALARDWRRYSTGHHIITRSQMLVRATTCGLLVGQLILVAVGLRLRFATWNWGLIYWMGVTALSCVAMVLAIWDLRQVRRRARGMRAENLAWMSWLLRNLRHGPGTDPGRQ